MPLLNTADKVYLGATAVDAVYLGSTKVWPAPSTGDPYRAAVMALSPFAYWRLGEASGTTGADESGNGHDLTYSGATLGQTSLVSTTSDTAVKFSDSGYAVSDAFFNAGASAFTVEGWVYGDFSAATNHALVSTGAGSGPGRGLLSLDGARSLRTFWGGAGKQDTGFTFPNNAVTHVALVNDYGGGGYTSIYVNGVVKGTWAINPEANSGASIILGASVTYGTNSACTMDEWAVHPAALTAEQIGVLARGGN